MNYRSIDSQPVKEVKKKKKMPSSFPLYIFMQRRNHILVFPLRKALGLLPGTGNRERKMEPGCGLELHAFGVAGMKNNFAKPNLKKKLESQGIIQRDNTAQFCGLAVKSGTMSGIQVGVRLWYIHVKDQINHRTKILTHFALICAACPLN